MWVLARDAKGLPTFLGGGLPQMQAERLMRRSLRTCQIILRPRRSGVRCHSALSIQTSAGGGL
jgi:hypothetical protein